jgi:hypothetical protein
MGEVTLNFDDEDCKKLKKPYILTLKARVENIV